VEPRWRWSESFCSRSLGSQAGSFSGQTRLCLSVMGDVAKAAAAVERVTGIESGLSAWESVPSGPVTWPDLRVSLSVSDRERPLVGGVNGPLMARRTTIRPALMAALLLPSSR
jgi:hypothetical protein